MTAKRITAVFLIVLLLLTASFTVFADTVTATDSSETTLPEEETVPEVDIKEYANAAMIYCVDTKTVLYSKNPDLVCIASASSKLMSALVAYEHIDDLETTVEVTGAMLENVSGNIYGFSAGMKPTYDDLITAMLIRNANDAAMILSRTVCESSDTFVQLMNEKAQAFGMKDTVYSNPTGIGNNSKTSVSDMIILLEKILENNLLLEISGTPYTKLTSTGVTIYSRNFFLTSYYNGGQSYINKNVIGGIAGLSEEFGDTLLTIAKNGSFTYLIAVSGAQRSEDSYYSYLITNELLNFGATSFEYITLLDTAQAICSLPVEMGNGSDEVTIFPSKKVIRYLEKDTDTESRVYYTYNLEYDKLTAPVTFGTKVGTLLLYLDGVLIEKVDLVTKTDIPSSSSDYLLSEISVFIKSDFFIKLIIWIVGICLIYILIVSIVRGQKQRRLNRANDNLNNSGKDNDQQHL